MTKKVIIAILYLFSLKVYGSELSNWYNDNILSKFGRFPTQTEIASELLTAYQAKNFFAEQFLLRVGGKCYQKNEGNSLPRGPITQAEVQANTRRHILFWGDSLFDFIDTSLKPINDSENPHYVNPELYFGSNWNLIGNAALGGTTTEDLRNHLDLHANYQYDKFYPNPYTDGHVNLENRYAVILYGGNDLLRFEIILKALPFLTVFRQNAVVNNLNRIVSYHQAQGSRVLLVSQAPRPTLEFNYFGDFGELGQFFSGVMSYFYNILAYALVQTNTVVNDINSCIAQGMCYPAQTIKETTVSAIYSGSHGRELEIVMLNKLKNPGHDMTWLSQQLGYMSLMTRNYVALQRNVEYLDEWAHFLDPKAVEQRKWWLGNKILFEDDYVHFSHPWGHALNAQNITNRLNQLGWWANPIPTQGDRCNFTSSASFPTGQPAIWTPEPPPLPGADENAMLLLLLCFYFGVCSF